jgi:hypothetical protein
MNDTRIPPSLEVRREKERRDRDQWRRSARTNVTVFLLSLAGWSTGAFLWWLGGKL